MSEQELESEFNFEYVEANTEEKISRPYFFLKRLCDITFSFIAIIVLSPVMICVIVIIKLTSRGPAIYTQERIGRGGKIFKIYKFRSMVDGADSLVNKFTEEQRQYFEINYKLAEDPRITKIGGFLRRSSIDELPQLVNILRGEMSIVGPRPITLDEVEKYGNFANAYFSVSPGLTGMWQVNGRSTTTYDDRVMMDVEYVNNLSTINDGKLVIKTFGAVLLRKGAY